MILSKFNNKYILGLIAAAALCVGFLMISSQVDAQQCLGCAPYSGATSGFWSCCCPPDNPACNNCCGGGSVTYCQSGCGGGGGGGGACNKHIALCVGGPIQGHICVQECHCPNEEIMYYFYCGDGTSYACGEQCDLGWGNNSNNPNSYCRANCTLAFCGDGIVDTNPQFGTRSPEECDLGWQNNSDLPGSVCSATCKILSTANAWLATTGSNAYSTQGFLNNEMQNISKLNPPITKAKYGYDFNSSVNLSKYLAAVGNTQLPNSFVSETSFVATNYTNNAVESIWVDSGESTFTRVIDKAAQSTTTNVTQASLLGGTLSSKFGLAVNSNQILVRQGNLIVGQGLQCDMAAIIIVRGNLDIAPSITNVGNNNGCLFIVDGNVTVAAGSAANPANVAFNQMLEYDRIEAAIIAKGNFTASADPQSSNVGDGMLIRGFLLAKQYVSQRNLTSGRNAKQPSDLFIFDARFIANPFFRAFLDERKFSLREL